MMTVFISRIKTNKYFKNGARLITFETDGVEYTFTDNESAINWLDGLNVETVNLVEVKFK